MPKIWLSDHAAHLAKSLQKLYAQVNELVPGRSTEDDGSIGDSAHQATNSDHNPDHGVVRALDLTHDPMGGFDSYEFARLLASKRDPRIQYIISNGRISNPDVQYWKWRPYDGKNPHDKHVHISVRDTSEADTDTPWDLSGFDTSPLQEGSTYRPLPRLHLGSRGSWVEILQKALQVEVDGVFGKETDLAVRAFQKANDLGVDGWVGPATWSKLGILSASGQQVMSEIIATRFGGISDPNYSAYDSHLISADELGAALPFRFSRPPLIWVQRGSITIRNIPVVDVGPIYPHKDRGPEDPYWETGQRPRAERLGVLSCAGIDLTPAVADRLGITEEMGKATVSWGFMTLDTSTPPTPPLVPGAEPPDEPKPLAVDWAALIAAGATLVGPWLKAKLENRPAPEPKREDLTHLLALALPLVLAILNPQPQKPPMGPLDRALGGEAMVGKKTATGLIGLLTAIGLQFNGTIPPITEGTTGSILATILPLGLTLLGLIAKLDRKTNGEPK